MRDVIEKMNNEEPLLPPIYDYTTDEDYPEFGFSDQYGLDVIAHTLIVALMRRDEHEADAYEDFLEYAARDAERQRQDEQQYPEWLEF